MFSEKNKAKMPFLLLILDFIPFAFMLDLVIIASRFKQYKTFFIIA